jgi:hypothetical protein
MNSQKPVYSLLPVIAAAIVISILFSASARSQCTPGDADGSGSLTMSDAGVILTKLCVSPSDTLTDCADADGDCDIDVFDLWLIFSYVFSGGDPPVPPGCENPPVAQDPDQPDTVSLIPDGLTVSVGDKLGVPVYLANDERISRFTLDELQFDFGSDTDVITFDSATYSGTRLSGASPLPDRNITPDFPGSSTGGLLLVSLSTAALDDSLPPGSGPVVDLWFTATNEGLVDVALTHNDSILSVPFPPNAIVTEYTCFTPILNIGNITVEGMGQFVDCMESTADPSFIATPAGSHPFTVTLRDVLGDPVENSTDCWVEFVDCSGLELCSTQTAFPVVAPIAPSNADGEVTFFLAAGLCVPGCNAEVKASCGTIATVPVKCVDADGDLHVHPIGDIIGDPSCLDYNNDGEYDSDDQNIFNLYVWQLCGDPCSAYRLSISYDPEDSLTVGTEIDIQATFENTTADPCSLVSITFYATCFGAGQDETIIGSESVNAMIQPGWSYSATINSFPIPACGLGCLKAVATVDGCDSPIETKTCPQVYFECSADAGTCYPFKTFVVQMSYVFIQPPVSLPPGFALIAEPSEGWYSAGDTIYVEICHTDEAVIQDSVSYRFYVSDDDILSADDDQYINKVAVRANSGDVTHDCIVDIDDAVYEICYVFDTCSAPVPIQIGNVNCSEDLPIDIDDIVYLINYIFSGGEPPQFCPDLIE